MSSCGWATPPVRLLGPSVVTQAGRVTILPWNSQNVLSSTSVTAFEVMGVPAAAEVMSFVVLTAVLSCLNSGLYTASRMLFSLAGRGGAPTALRGVTERGVPARAILASTVVGYVSVVAAYISGPGLPLPAQLLGLRDPLRPPDDLPVRAADAAAPGARGARATDR